MNKNRLKVRDAAREKLINLYLECSDVIDHTTIEPQWRETAHGENIWWLEPLLKSPFKNFCVRERNEGDSWAIFIEELPERIRSFGGL